MAQDPQRFCDPTFDMTPWWEGHTFNMDVVGRISAQIKAYDPTPRFGEITCPVFIAVGVHDYPIPPLVWAGWKDRLPNATYHVFERSGHHPHYEEQTLFDERISQWLTSR